MERNTWYNRKVREQTLSVVFYCMSNMTLPYFSLFLQGSVFFSFPDGNGMLYSLQGTADPPKPEDTIIHQLSAKTHHSKLLSINNWLSRQQRYNTHAHKGVVCKLAFIPLKCTVSCCFALVKTCGDQSIHFDHVFTPENICD